MSEITPALALSAYLLGRRIAGQRKRVPVAYLYNGVRLPGLPEWDKGKYWCATLIDITTAFDASPRYKLFLSGGYAFNEYDGYYGIGLLHAEENGIIAYECSYNYVSKEYQWDDEKTTGYIDGYALSNTLRNDVIWTNTDIVLPDGTLFLAASNPIPIYE